MKRLLYIIILSCCVCSCAKQPPPPVIAGRWQGYYVYDFRIYDTIEKVLKDTTKITIDIKQIDDSTLTCKTYCGEFADAIGTGKFNAELETITLSETKIDKLRFDTSGIETCLSNYFLLYKKVQSEEQLIGTLKSQPSVNGADCGGGDVYLKRVKN
jgi:hypothetical protein